MDPSHFEFFHELSNYFFEFPRCPTLQEKAAEMRAQQMTSPLRKKHEIAHLDDIPSASAKKRARR